MDDEGGAAAEPPPPLPAASVPLASPTLASAASLSRVDLPLAPALAPPIDGLASSDSEAAPAALPAPPPGASPLRAASLRLLSAAAVQRPGTEVYAWGRGDCGQLGSGSAEDSAEPRLVEGLQGRDVVGLAGGRLHTAAVTGANPVGWVCWDTAGLRSDCVECKKHRGNKHARNASLPPTAPSRSPP